MVFPTNASTCAKFSSVLIFSFSGVAPFFDLRCRSFRLVELMQASDHAIDLRFSDCAFREQFAQEPAVRQFSHLHAVFSDLSVFVVEGEAGIAFVDRHHGQIDFRTESPIQLQLASAKVVALFERAEIEKAEIHGLLHFEDEGRSDEDPRDVCLNRAHFQRAMCV